MLLDMRAASSREGSRGASAGLTVAFPCLGSPLPLCRRLQSYRRFMQEHLWSHVDIHPGAAHIPDGTLPLADVPAACRAYEAEIHAAGGIDLQLLGIGRTGHVGFNEKGSPPTSRTRLVTLDRVTRVDAAADFFGEAAVPRRAITMGVGTIMEVGPLMEAWGFHHGSMGGERAREGCTHAQGRPGRIQSCQPPCLPS